MSARLSKDITNCVRSGHYLLSAFDTEGPRVAASFLDTTGPHLEEGDVAARPDGFLVAVARRLRASLDHLVATDFAVAHAAARESELRARRKADKRQLAFLIVALRRLVLGQYVEPDLDNLGLQPVNVRDSVTVLRRGELVGQRFEAVNLAEMLGKSRFEGPVDLSPFVAEIRGKSAELLALAEEVNEAQRATDRARIERDRAKETYDRAYLRGARMFEDLCRFAGLDGLAASIRRWERRPTASETVSSEASEESSVDETVTDTLSLDATPLKSRLESRDAPMTGRRRDDPLPAVLDDTDRAVDVGPVYARVPADVRGPAGGGPGAGPSPPPAAHPEALPALLRPLRGQRPGVRPEGPADPGAGARSGPRRRPAGGGQRRQAPGEP